MTRPVIMRVPHKEWAQRSFGTLALQIIQGRRDLDPDTKRALMDAFTAIAEIGGRDELDNYLSIERAFATYVANIVTVTAGNNGIYGDATDGVVTFDGSSTVLGLAPSSGVYTLTRDLYLASGSSVSLGATVLSAGYRIFCTGTFNLAGTIHNNGVTAGNVDNAGNAGTQGTGGLSAVLGRTAATGGGDAKGAAGGVGLGGTTDSLGGSGGAGGGTTPGTGNGTAGTVAAPPTATVGGYPRNLWSAMSGARSADYTRYDNATGGSGGSSTGGVARGGGGGGGGGIVGLYIFKLVNTGAIQAKGGNGGNGGGSTGIAGGGGGGGGGGVILVCGPDSTTGTITAAGGTGGSPVSTGGTGASGSNGHIFILQ